MKFTINTALYGLLMLSGLSVVQSAVMSIDFGTEWIKIGLVKPSVPFDIVLNRDSKRKTQAVLTIRGTERTFSVNGQALGIRFPKDSFSDLKLVLGQHFDSKQSKEYRNTHWTRISKDEDRNVAIFSTDNNSKHSVEELTAMLFQYAREEAEITAGEKIKDVVITIPTYFTQYERQTLLDAAEIAELKVLSLINDGSAVALNYAMTRKFSKPQRNIIFDIGSGNSIATLINFKEVTSKEGKYKRNVTYSSVEVIAVGYDKTLGGKDFDQRIQKLLIDQFTSKNPNLSKKITESPRALSKLLKEATKMKQILSANKDAYLSIESLHEDIDFKTKITREEFEKVSDDLFERALNPINDALTSANMKIDQIDNVILVGGSVRIPKVQAALTKLVGEKKISQSVNGDEAAAIGATFRGASLSSQFKVKDIRLKDINVYPIEAIVTPVSKDIADKKFIINIVGSNAPSFEYKFMPIKFNSDFDFILKYPDTISSIKESYGCTELGEASVRGIDENLEKFKDRIIGEPKVRVLVSISTSGIISTPKAQLVLQLKPLEKPSETPETVSNTEDAKESSNDTETPKEESKKIITEKIQLELKFTPTCFRPMNKKEIKEASERLTKLNNLDKERFARDEAMNNLESFIYSNDYFIESDEAVEVTSEEERAKLEAAVATASEWLMENTNASKKEFEQKLKELQKLKTPIDLRIKEFEARPKAIKSLQETLDTIDKYADKLVENITPENKEILAPVFKEIQEEAKSASTWLTEKLEQQSQLENYKDPILLTKDIEKRHKQLDDLKFKLVSKILSLPKPEPKSNASKDKGDSTAHSKNGNDTKTDDDTASTGEASSSENTTKVENGSSSVDDEKDEL